MVIFDSNFVLTFLCEAKKAPIDPVTKQPLTYYNERVAHLVDCLKKEKQTIGIPTPVLSEIGIQSDRATPELVSELASYKWFEFLSFDTISAIECALMARTGFQQGNKKYDGNDGAVWQKLKIDRQIFAIAKAYSAQRIYTTDTDLLKLGSVHEVECVRIFDLPVPDSAKQMSLDMAQDEPDQKEL